MGDVKAGFTVKGLAGLKVSPKTQRRAVERGAQIVAVEQRKQIKAGLDAKGGALPDRKAVRPGGKGAKGPGGTPLVRTGALVKSVKRTKARGSPPFAKVLPTGKNEDGTPNALKLWDYQRDHGTEVMGVSDAVVERARQAVEDEIARALGSGSDGSGGAGAELANLFGKGEP
jgi:hypothetical protein